MKTELTPVLLLLIFAFSCSDNMDPNPPETLDPEGRPFFRYVAERNHYFIEPWNYSLPQNSEKTYPLVIFLHGSGGAGDISYLNFLGYDTDDGVDDTVALGFQQRFPSFVLVPQTNGEWDNQKLIEEGEYLKKNYRIDTTRIYLIGYSMGGSGSYSLANSWYDNNKHLFAGIIRLVGQSQTVVRDSIAERTAIWLHIGLDDLPERVQVVRDAYSFLKSYHKDAIETVTDTVMGGFYPAKTYSLIIDNYDRVKLTEYSNAGHGIVTVPFWDKRTIAWLFSHTLDSLPH